MDSWPFLSVSAPLQTNWRVSIRHVCLEKLPHKLAKTSRSRTRWFYFQRTCWGSDNNIDQRSETVSAGANSEILNIFAAYIYHNPLMCDLQVALQSLKKVPPSSSWVNFIFFLPNVTVVHLIFVDIYFSTLSEAKNNQTQPCRANFSIHKNRNQ